jgi:hypothetical protein
MPPTRHQNVNELTDTFAARRDRKNRREHEPVLTASTFHESLTSQAAAFLTSDSAVAPY